MIMQSITLKQALEELSSYFELEENWDSYGAAVISPLAISFAEAVLMMLARKYPEYADRLRFVGPVPNGGVSLEWRRRETADKHEFLEIYFNEDATIEFVMGNEDYLSPSWMDGPIDSLLDARTTIYSFLVAENS